MRLTLSHRASSTDVPASRALVLRILSDSLARDSGCADQVARSLYDLAVAGEIVDPELKSLAWWAWDALDLAEARMIAETRDDIIDKMRSALDSSASNESNSSG